MENKPVKHNTYGIIWELALRWFGNDHHDYSLSENSQSAIIGDGRGCSGDIERDIKGRREDARDAAQI